MWSPRGHRVESRNRLGGAHTAERQSGRTNVTLAKLKRGRLPVALAGALVPILAVDVGCGTRNRSANTEPVGWFDLSFRRAPPLAPVRPAPAAWVTVEVRDGLSIRLSSEYGVRNDFCREKNVNRWPGPGWIDVCLSREHHEILARAYHLQPALPGGIPPTISDPTVIDMVVYDSWREEAGLLGGRRALIERARASGGMAGHKRERTVSALIELGPGDWVMFTGRTGDDAGYDELLTIASTILVTGPRPAPQ